MKKRAQKDSNYTMVASNELNPHYFIETAELLFDLVAELSKELGIFLEMVNLGAESALLTDQNRRL